MMVRRASIGDLRRELVRRPSSLEKPRLRRVCLGALVQWLLALVLGPLFHMAHFCMPERCRLSMAVIRYRCWCRMVRDVVVGGGVACAGARAWGAR
mmetsp:Transcript_31777/g.76193  ORF Transcript_31777/g.76193 Transcript_31777/m.76193 type:complete len:96 (+) Transcript_31777:73-360(+)